MCLIKKVLYKSLLTRYDKDGIIPYFKASDFAGLNMEEKTFTNSKGIEIHYYFYYYDIHKNDKIILFCHGLGPGHEAYLAEIETLCKEGYKVLTLDYSGCGKSGGDRLYSMNAPTRDIIELLNLLNLQEEIVIFGHSLGGYSAINILNFKKDITKAIILSGFINVKSEMKALTKSNILAQLVVNFERRQDKEYSNLDNVNFLKNTTDNILFIQSKDDQLVPYDTALGKVISYNNPHIICLTLEGKKHNPNYTYEAVKYMNGVFSEYNRLIKNKTLDTFEKRKEYMSDKSIAKMTKQDKHVWEDIFSFINK